MSDLGDTDRGRQPMRGPGPSQRDRQFRAPERDEATLRRSIANADPGNIGFAYSAPERGADPEVPVTRLGLVWRIVASVALAAVGVNAVVVLVRLLAQSEPAWVGALGMAVVAMLTLAYPVVNVRRAVRAVRGRRRAGVRR